jgi:excisionase family DNA binding protein
MTPAILTITQAAYMLSLREAAISRLAREGLIPYRRLGRRLLFLPAELETWLSLLPGVSVAEAVAAQHAQHDAMTKRRYRRPTVAAQATA